MAHKKDATSYKIKLLVLYGILRQETNENNMLTTKELIEKLKERGISCDRKILYDDIQTLNDNGYEILTERGQQMKYYVPEAGFDDYELRILLDAVQSAKFITPNKTKELEKKITYLAGAKKDDFAQKNITCLNTKKSYNEKIFYNVINLTEAIQQEKKITFRYFDLSLTGAKVLRHNGAWYQENPIDLIINEDNYYLVTFNEEKQAPKTYRVDRMDSVQVLDVPAVKKKVKEAQKLRSHSFSMFSGEEKEVTLRFDKGFTNQVIDKLGFDFRVIDDGEKYATIKCTVDVSYTFYAWCFTFGEKMQILAPDDVKSGYQKMLQSTLDSTK